MKALSFSEVILDASAAPGADELKNYKKEKGATKWTSKTTGHKIGHITISLTISSLGNQRSRDALIIRHR